MKICTISRHKCVLLLKKNFANFRTNKRSSVLEFERNFDSYFKYLKLTHEKYQERVTDNPYPRPIGLLNFRIKLVTWSKEIKYDSNENTHQKKINY